MDTITPKPSRIVKIHHIQIKYLDKYCLDGDFLYQYKQKNFKWILMFEWTRSVTKKAHNEPKNTIEERKKKQQHLITQKNWDYFLYRWFHWWYPCRTWNVTKMIAICRVQTMRFEITHFSFFWFFFRYLNIKWEWIGLRQLQYFGW